MRTYVGEVYFNDGTYTLVGNELQLEDHALFSVEVNGEEQEIRGFNTLNEATQKTELFATLQNAKDWQIRFFDIELEAYCDWCGKYGHLEEDCTK